MKTKIIIFTILLFLLFGLNFVFAQEQVDERTVQINETPEREEVIPNYGEICTSSGDCIKGFCLKCPIDTQVVIQTDPDPHYAELINDTHFVTKSSDKAYCANTKARCVGNLDDDEYFIYPSPRYWRPDLYPSEYATEKEKELSELDLSMIKELTKEGLDKWKTLVLNDISEDYFREHIDVIKIESQIEDNILGMGIQYKFKFDWAVTDNTDREVIYIKQLSGGEWIWLGDEEITRRFNQSRESLHNMVFLDGSVGYTKSTEYEILSIISREEASSKLKQCHGDMKIETVGIGSKNNIIQLTASGKVDINTENCAISHENKYTVVLGGVNLVTGESNCASQETPCVIYAPKEGNEKQPLSGQNLTLYVGIGIFIIILIIVIVLVKRRK